MKTLESRRLAVIWSLTGGLEVQPLLGLVIFGEEAGIAHILLFAVGVKEVFNDGAGLPELGVTVWVLDSGEAAVGMDPGVWFLF